MEIEIAENSSAKEIRARFTPNGHLEAPCAREQRIGQNRRWSVARPLRSGRVSYFRVAQTSDLR
jgi:hypothetical protein